MREEEDLAWQLGIGCGGLVRILLQPILAEHHYLDLCTLQQQLKENIPCAYQQKIDESSPVNKLIKLSELITFDKNVSSSLIIENQNDQFIQHYIKPPIHLAVFGGGVDARPLVSIAGNLGWRITLIDPRTANAREQYFNDAEQIIKEPIPGLENASWLDKIDAALILCHNVDLDAEALTVVQQSAARFVGLLGPVHRTERVLESAKLTRAQLLKPLANPVGLRLGGELPESIALSMISEVHAFLHGSDAKSITNSLNWDER